jgi:hypothetical protein
LKTRYLTLAALLAPVLSAHAQEAFNPMTFLAPIMTPLGAMMVPMMMNGSMNQFNTAMYNPAALFNPATMANPLAMMPAMPTTMPNMPGYGVPAGMVPFTGIQPAPQAYGMPAADGQPLRRQCADALRHARRARLPFVPRISRFSLPLPYQPLIDQPPTDPGGNPRGPGNVFIGPITSPDKRRVSYALTRKNLPSRPRGGQVVLGTTWRTTSRSDPFPSTTCHETNS